MQKTNSELFTTMPVGKAVAKLAVPTVISQIVVILYSLADTFFVGQIGDPNQLAALSITFPIFTLLTAVPTCSASVRTASLPEVWAKMMSAPRKKRLPLAFGPVLWSQQFWP